MTNENYSNASLVTEGLYFNTTENKLFQTLSFSTVELQPIQLTPKWFERFGFTLIKKDRCINNATKSNCVEYQFQVEYQFELENTRILFYGDEGKACIMSITEQSASHTFQYVHELQLLFAAFKIYLTLNDQNNV